MAHLSVKTSPELTHRITNRMQRDKKPTLSEYERHRYKSKTYGNVVIYTSGKLVCMGSDEQVDRFRDHFYDPSIEDRSTHDDLAAGPHLLGGGVGEQSVTLDAVRGVKLTQIKKYRLVLDKGYRLWYTVYITLTEDDHAQA